MSINKTAHTLLLIISVMVFIFLHACSNQKNTTLTRFYHSTNTRYNIHFNANEAYKEAMYAKSRSQEDNLSEMLYIFPDNSDSASMQSSAGSFTTTVDKTTKAIKLHSIKVRPKRDAKRRNDANYQAWLKQQEFTPFMDQVWLLLAKAEFQEGDYLQAITTFMYITKIYSSRPEIVTECQLWIARAYTEMGWMYEAGNVLHKMELAGGPPEKHKGLYSAVKANYLIRSEDYKEAIPHLEFAIKKEKDKHQRLRMKYLLGQLYTEIGDIANADKAYAAVQGMNTPYKFTFNAKLQQYQLNASSKRDAIASLSKMARSEKNKDYLDQIYFSIGNLYIQQGDTVKAIENYKKAIDESTRNGYDKAMAQVILGDLYFDRNEFIPAQPAYSDALSQLKKSHTDYLRVAHRSDVLDELVVHIKTVAEQDSLQHLASLPEEERIQIILQKIDELKKEEEEKRKQEEREQQQEERQTRISSWSDLENASRNTQPNTAQTGQQAAVFYFYNEQAVAQGKIAFQRQWDNRKLEDDWRRSSKLSFSSGFDDDTELANETDSLENKVDKLPDTADGSTATISDDIYSVEYYMQQLPLTEEAKKASDDLIDNALFNMGKIYKNKLENMVLAVDAFTTDISRFPQTPNLEEIYFQLFLIYLQAGNHDLMTNYRNKLVSEFPKGEYAIPLSEPDYEWNFRHMPILQDSLYNSAFHAYQRADVQTVRNDYQVISKKYPLTDLMPKFTLLNALSYAQTRDAKGLTDNLKEITEKYPKSDVAPLANEILERIKNGKVLLSDGTPITDFDWSKAYISDDLLAGEEGQTLAFSDETDTEYLLLLMFKPNTIDRNELLYEVADYNFSNYVIQTFDLSFESDPPYDILQMKGFKSFANIRSYLNKAFTEEGLMNKIDTTIFVLPISVNNYIKILPRLGVEQYTEFFTDEYKDQLPLLIAYWNKDAETIKDELAQMEQNVIADDGEDNDYDEPFDTDENDEPVEIEIVRIPPPVKQTDDKEKQEQTVDDKEISADELLSEEMREKAGQVNDAVSNIMSNPVDGIKNLFKKDQYKEKLTKEEKAALKEKQREEKQKQKELQAIEKSRQDSINKIEKALTDSIFRTEKAVQDSIKNAEKQKEQLRKQEEQQKTEAAKQVARAKDDERKQKEQERKDKERLQKEKLRQQEQERKQKEKEREQLRKEKERQQKERQQQREKERKEKEKQAKASRKD